MNNDLMFVAWELESYAKNLKDEKPEWAEAVLECVAIIEERAKLVPTITKISHGSCQELFNFLVIPEIDYQSGFQGKQPLTRH